MTSARLSPLAGRRHGRPQDPAGPSGSFGQAGFRVPSHGVLTGAAPRPGRLLSGGLSRPVFFRSAACGPP